MLPPYVGQQPRFSPAAGQLFRRYRFLDGTFQTYFAPGQGFDILGDYYPPNDWRPSGGVLTPPQVVWMTVATIDSYIENYEIQFTNGIYLDYRATTTSPPQNEWALDTNVTVTYWYFFSDGTIVTSIVTFTVGTFGTQTNVAYFPAPASPYSYPLVPQGFVAPDQLTVAALNASGGNLVRNDSTDPPVKPQFSNPFQPGFYTLPVYAGSLSITDPGLLAWANQFPTTVVYDQLVPNLMAIQRERLLPIFNDVASQLASIRSGRTWGLVNDLSFSAGTFFDFSPCLSQLIAPDSTQGPFFGVDFLHIHCLAWSEGGQSPADGPVTPGFYQPSRDQLTASFPSFVRYNCMLYGPDGQYALFPAPKPIPQIGQPSGAFDGGSAQGPVTTEVIDDITNTANNPIAMTFNDNRLTQIQAQNTLLQARNPTINAELQFEASDLSDFGISYEGGEAQLSDADTVLALIADHFNFDPDTGANLGNAG